MVPVVVLVEVRQGLQAHQAHQAHQKTRRQVLTIVYQTKDIQVVQQATILEVLRDR